MRKHVPFEEKLYTWWSYRSPNWRVADKGRRLDHIWSTTDIAALSAGTEVVSAARGWGKQPSDHVPVLVRIGEEGPA